jgi:hypothetical protein
MRKFRLKTYGAIIFKQCITDADYGVVALTAASISEAE